MADTYTQLYYHVVFVVSRRNNLISNSWKTELYKYITGIIRNKNQKMMIINGMPDHIHLLIGVYPNCNLSDLLRDVKANSSKWINEKNFTKFKFEWQKGFGAFTLGYSQLPVVINYIKQQERHHQNRSFRKEYISLLRSYEVEYNEKYIFE